MKRTRGFSLLEMAVMVLITGIVVGMAAPSFSGMTGAYRLATNADMLAGELQMARMLAITRNAQYTVTLTGRTISIADPTDPENPRLNKTMDTGMSFLTLPAQSIIFYSRGNARGGTIVVGNEKGTKTIEVLSTGRIRVRG